MSVTRLSVAAMRTRFEVLVLGEPIRARAAAEAAIAEIERVEAMLSPFNPASEVSAINAYAAERPVRVSAEMLFVLKECALFHRLTEGAFDPTVGPLLRLWGLRGAVAEPTADELAEVRRRVGFDLVELDDEAQTVRFQQPGMSLDFGAVGKGMAVEWAYAELHFGHAREALVHGGTSTVRGTIAGPDGEGWTVAVGDPREPGKTLATVGLGGSTLSVSTREGRLGEVGERRVSHVIDPRTGRPVDGPRLAAVHGGSAPQTDAWSTALLVDPTLAGWRDGAGPLASLLLDDDGVHTDGLWTVTDGS